MQTRVCTQKEQNSFLRLTYPDPALYNINASSQLRNVDKHRGCPSIAERTQWHCSRADTRLSSRVSPVCPSTSNRYVFLGWRERARLLGIATASYGVEPWTTNDEREERGLSTSDNEWEEGAVACVSYVEFDVECARCEFGHNSTGDCRFVMIFESRNWLGLKEPRILEIFDWSCSKGITRKYLCNC